MTHRVIGFVMIALIGIGCASMGGGSAAHKSCVLPARDSTFAAGGAVYRDCAVDRVARLTTTSIHPDYRPTSPPSMGMACYAADVEFVVDSAGRPESQNAIVLRTTDQGYAESVVALLNRLRYEPAVRGSIPVRQIVLLQERMATQTVLVKQGSAPPSPSSLGPVPLC